MTATKTNALSRALSAAYKRGVDDEMLEPLVLLDEKGNPEGRLQRGDSVIFYNIRGEREIELTRSLTERNFGEFPVERDLDLNFATMIEYKKGLPVAVAFPPEECITDTLSSVIARAGKLQTKITEAEKAIHLGYFLNGKRSAAEAGEERIIIATRKDVVLFDEAPRMSIDEITENVITKMRDKSRDILIVNYPNVDVVGHIENRNAVIDAVEAVDEALGIVLEEAEKNNVISIVTADHGTVEKWYYPDGKIDTGHTDSPVPFIIVSKDDNLRLRRNGELSDVAPSILHLMGIDIPPAMAGHSLICGDIEVKKRVLLLILDGWGLGEKGRNNLIYEAKTPVMDRLMSVYPHSILKASGEAVGLPEKTVGNSEVGHLHIGAGRRIYSDRVRINRAIAEGSFMKIEALNKVMDSSILEGSALHLMGIVSFFSSHGSVDHLCALMEMAKKKGVKELYVHAMLGRRGERPESGALYIEKIEQQCQKLDLGSVVSVIGRYWSMDREENWNRIEKTYRMLVYGEGTGIPERGSL
ncbi:MAG: sulfatase-like hydrolase/transferase [Syntrophales bacterium]|jgi:2,3-bisphosphoglycerate-independent phosphoglycerate mutase|nr:sulfatase-like hydrolase/transferase [Syntrophales bacterium]MDY0044955.1 sulfatase-like hydrolase/transferase [Syntrophales bacterium]